MLSILPPSQLHIFPEGRITQLHVPLQRLKWGLASIIDRVSAKYPPIVVCVAHSGFETVSGISRSGAAIKGLRFRVWDQALCFHHQPSKGHVPHHCGVKCTIRI